jgi:penicillin amidase
MEGVVKLKNAPGVATITREEETQIAHIYGDTLEAALYAQGYAHAQTRLWQMQMTRLAAQGRISEFFGEKAINIDKFMRVMEFYSLSEKSVKLFDEKETALYSSYLDGINDYV